jgi:hypothetical protein
MNTSFNSSGRLRELRIGSLVQELDGGGTCGAVGESAVAAGLSTMLPGAGVAGAGF